MNTVTFIEWLGQDIRYAARVLRRNPGFTIAAVLTLALGIGGVTVIYSALRNILLDPFPYANSERMVNVYVINAETGDRQHGGAMGQDEAVDFFEQQTRVRNGRRQRHRQRPDAHRRRVGHRHRHRDDGEHLSVSRRASR